jgi:ubiquinone biosynthesis protein UbiJ
MLATVFKPDGKGGVLKTVEDIQPLPGEITVKDLLAEIETLKAQVAALEKKVTP